MCWRGVLSLVTKSCAGGLCSLLLVAICLAGDFSPSGEPALSEADQHVATALKFEVEGDALSGT